MRQLLQQVRQLVNNRQPCVYCSIVETRGSTPQKAGAAMVVFPDGRQLGTLGGGCVEAEVKQNALRSFASDSAPTEIFTFQLDDNYGWDDGLICGGRMSVLATPLSISKAEMEAQNYFQCFAEMLEQGLGCTEAVGINKESSSYGGRWLFDANSRMVAQLGSANDTTTILEHLKPVTRRPKPYTVNGFSYSPFWPRITLLIVGGGHVGQAVAQLASDVDFDIQVLDDRDTFSNKERFPMAQKCYVGDIGQTLASLVPQHINEQTFCLIVTRGHNHDEEALYYLAESQAAYVGMIGSKRKIKLIYDDLVARGISKEALQRVHAPLGFNIGSQTVPEIAVSIVAELIACRNLGATISAARTKVEI